MELLGKLCMYGVFYGIVLVLILSYRGKTKEKQEILGKEAAGELKGIAILMVLVGHLTYMFGFLVIPLTPALGAPAVDIFLFLSAFGLMSSFNNKGLKDFFKRRFAVVLIPYIVVTLVKLAVYPILSPVSFKMILFNILPLSFDYSSSLDTSMWYVQYILIWYLIFYIIFSIPKLSVKVKTALIGAVGILAAVAFGILYYNGILFNLMTPLTESYSHNLSFPLGALFFLFYDKIKKIPWKIYLAVAAFSFLIFQFIAFPGVDGYMKYYVNNLFYVIFFVALMGVLRYFGRCSGLLSWLGKLSYYIYLNELIVMAFFYNISPLPGGINAVLIMTVSILLGWGEYIVCEWILKKLKVH